jgi:hypothetical protein
MAFCCEPGTLHGATYSLHRFDKSCHRGKICAVDRGSRMQEAKERSTDTLILSRLGPNGNLPGRTVKRGQITGAWTSVGRSIWARDYHVVSCCGRVEQVGFLFGAGPQWVAMEDLWEGVVSLGSKTRQNSISTAISRTTI